MFLHPGDVLLVMCIHRAVGVMMVCRVQACVEVSSNYNLLVLCGCLSEECANEFVNLFSEGHIDRGDIDPDHTNSSSVCE